MTVVKLAADLGVSRQSIYDWAKEGCPVHAGRDAIISWHANNKRPGRSHMRQSRLLQSPPAAIDDEAEFFSELCRGEEFLCYQIDLALKLLDTVGGDLAAERRAQLDEYLNDVAAVLLRRRSSEGA